MDMIDLLAAVSDRAPNDNMRSVVAGLETRGEGAGLDRPHRLAQYVPQITHESGRFRYDREVWGPTPAQKRYDTRTDLGNTAARDGDGFKFRGRTAMQITGGHNTREFRDWCREVVDPHAPDFVANPDLMNTDPWEGLGPIWYWETRSLNRYADEGDAEMVTRRINGGLNGFEDRLQLLDRTSLILLGYRPIDVRVFQDHAGLKVDGISGPRTRAAFHAALLEVGATDSEPAPNVSADALARAERAEGKLREIHQLSAGV